MSFSKTLTPFGTIDPFDGKRPLSVEERLERAKKVVGKSLLLARRK